MESVLSLAVKILDEARAQIQANMAKRYRTSKGERWINASGRSSEAFKVEEVGGVSVRLVYRGEGVAPLDSIQYGTDEVPDIQTLARWTREKGLPINPYAVQRGIIKRGGTERFNEPQEWVINPVVDEAVAQLNERLPQEAVRAVRAAIFGQN